MHVILVCDGGGGDSFLSAIYNNSMDLGGGKSLLLLRCPDFCRGYYIPHCSSYFLRGRRVFEPPRYMTIGQAAGQLVRALSNRERDGHPLTCEKFDLFL